MGRPKNTVTIFSSSASEPEAVAQARRGRVAEALRSLAGSEAVPMRVRGDCMSPVLRHEDQVEVVSQSVYCPGDVVAFLSAKGDVMLHRCLGYRPTRSGWRLVTGADAAHGIDPPVDSHRVIGRVLRVRGRGARFRVSWRDRLLAVWRFCRHAASGSVRALKTLGNSLTETR